MSEQTTLPWSWVKRVDRNLYNRDTIPLMGEFPSFPFSLLEEKIKATLKLQKFSIQALEPEWKEYKDIFTGIGEPHEIFSIVPSGIDGEIYFALSKGDLLILAAELLKLPQDTVTTLPEKYIEQLSTFVSAEALFAVNSLKYVNLSFSFSSKKEIGPQAHLTQDLYIECGDTRIRVRTIFSDAFRTSSIECMQRVTGSTPSKENLRALSLKLHIEAGRTILSIDELQALRPGDFVLIDKPIYNPSEKTPQGVIFLAGKPLFRVAVQEKKVQILEIPLYNEVYGHMTNKIEFAPHDDDEEIEKEPAEEVGEENDEEMFAPFAEDESEDDIEEEVEDEEDSKEEDSTEETAEELTEEEASHEDAEPEHITHEEAVEDAEAHIISPDGKIHLNQIPVTVRVELAQISMSAEKLFQLQPGNMIDCNSAGNIAHLVVDDIIIGKGEIIKIGDNVGIRILEIAAHE